MKEETEITIAEYFANNAQSSKITGQKEAVDKVLKAIASTGISEKDVNDICEGLTYILNNYNHKSKSYLERLLPELIAHYPQWTIKRLSTKLSHLGNHYKKIVSNNSTSKCCLLAFKISLILLEKGWSSDCLKSNLPAITEAQMYFICSLVSAGVTKYLYKASAMISSIQKRIPSLNLSYVEILESFEPSFHVPIFGSFLCDGITDNEILLQELTLLQLNIFIKTLVNVKTKPLKSYILACYPFLKNVTMDQFNELLLPSLQKSLLRNPEVILECVGLIISGITLDLSKCAPNLSKPLLTNLTSKDDLTRNESVDAFKSLAQKVSDPDAIQEILKQIFAVFHGSAGKISVAEHKISILQAAGNLSFNNVLASNKNNLVILACEQFIKVLETEVQEKTLCSALNILPLWLVQSKPFPEKIFNSLKNGINLKTTTSLVRISYIQCFLSVLEEGGIDESCKLIPIFLNIFEKAVGQSNQVVTITEALASVCVILKLIPLGEQKNYNLQNFWNVIFDMEKQVFVSEKYISTSSDEAMILVMKLCKILLLEYSEKIHNKAKPLYRAVLLCLTTNSLPVRKECTKILKNLLAGLTGVSIARSLLSELAAMLEVDNLCPKAEKNEISPHILGLCITSICSANNLITEDAQKIVLNALLPAHYPSIMNTLGNLWMKILIHMKINDKSFIKDNIEELENIFCINYKPTKSYENALATIVSMGGGLFLQTIVNNITNKLEDPRILQISKDDYFIYLTPEGEIYDKSVIPGQDENSAINMKRESKAYSFKEQQEELQLRRELEEKKKKEGKFVTPQYTPKQLEVIKNQKLKEQEIRNRLIEINAVIGKCLSQLNAISKGNPQDFSFYCKDIIPIVLKNCASPLAAPQLTNLYLNLRNSVFNKEMESISKTIAYTTLRLIKPQCDLDSCWEEEDLNKATTRIMNVIYSSTRGEQYNFSVFAFTYTFPFIKKCLLSEHTKKNESSMQHGLQILSEFSKIATAKASHKNFVTNLEALPRKQMLELLFELISSTNGRIQSHAEAVLLDVASTANTLSEIHLKASDEELDVLMMALQNSIGVVRDAALRSLIAMESCIPSFNDNPNQAFKLSKRIWIAKFDVDEQNRNLANKLWSSINYTCPPDFVDCLIENLEHPVDCIQASAAESLGAYLKTEETNVQTTVEKLIKLYRQRLTVIPSKVDEFGREIEKPIDIWQPRRGVALAFKHVAPLIESNNVGPLIDFFVSTSLADRIDKVRKEMLNAALTIVDIHGKETVANLLPVFENFMDKSSKSAHYDHVKQAVVILMGSLARHLDKDDQRIKPIVQRLISALSTPSQQVQESVANCLPHLVPSIKEEAPGYVNKLLHQLLKSDKYGDRKGAAYGLAGMVKGMGILALKQLDIMTKLTDAIQDKKNYKHREGALFAFEMLFQMLGKLFEPYIVHVLPHLLLCFGDSSQYVRNATDDTAKVVMSKLSGHGVKLVLPSLLAALEDDSWRTKTGSVELLGAMAYCAPKQLSSCLPSIVPKLIEVLSDSHLKVQEAGAEALKVIGSVIRNPEIQAIVPVLLNALQDPSHKTSACLQTLLDTQFVHFIDAPSLALIMPVVQRAFMDRSTETRKMAAQIIGNMYSLTDQKDLMPYLPKIIPGLKTSLLDPVPEVRSVSARALGAMVRGMGESHFEDLLPWLMQTLTSDTSSVDRSGAAQGLSEVVGGLGVEKLHKLMPEIIATAERTDIESHVKDGYIMMFIYMPVVFQQEFTPYIGQIINPILKALADEKEFVRDTALKAGQRIVTLYADSAILLLLPELERGLFDDNWRIRYSSVQLLGDLLYRISGVTGKMSTETASEDDNFGTEQSHTAIIHSLGAERRNRVLAGLYMGRSDVALMVRQAALHVWKVVVTNTPRTLREILPTLFGLLLGCLASESYDKRQVAARTLGDLVRKLGERVLPEIIPILEKGLQSKEADQRQGVCIGLSEIMASTSREMVLTFVNSLVPTVRKALCDPLPEVREAAGKTFDSLHSTVGSKALDDILPAMLNQLNDDDPDVVEWTLDGLRQVMSIKSRVVLPYLIPQLTAPPANTKALSILASVAGESLNKYLPKILPALLNALSTSKGTPEESQQSEYCQAVVLSIVDESGTRAIIDSLLESTRSESLDQRRSAAALLCAFCANTRAQYITHVPQLYRGLIHLCTDTDKEVLQMTWEALNAVTKTLDSKQQATFVFDIRQAVRFTTSDVKGTNNLLPGFCLPKGIAPILPIFREAILNGDGDEKESAALGLGEIIRLTNAQALQTSVVAITGPLIRILGDRFNPNVKTAVLETLAVLLEKVGIMLKQFLPQLQTTFVKALNDPNRVVRLKAAGALSHLILIHQRPDPLFSELHNTIKNSDDAAIRETTLHALRGIITPAGDKMTDAVKKQVHQTLLTLMSHLEDTTRICAAGCLGALCKYLTPEQLEFTLIEHILSFDQLDWVVRHGRSAALSVALKECPEVLWVDDFNKSIETTLLNQFVSDKVQITQNAIRSFGYLLQYLISNEKTLPYNMLGPFVKTMNNTNNDVKQLLARVCIHLAKNIPTEKMAPELLKLLLPMLVNGTKEKNGYVKANSEIALIAVLRLKEGDEVSQKCLQILDVGARESLSDVVSKVLRKIMNQHEGKEEELDNTLLS